MNEEIGRITERLDRLQGTVLAQQVLLTAIAQDLAGKDWTFLIDGDQAIDKYTDALRVANVSDLTLSVFQQTVQKILDSLSGIAPVDRPF